VANVRRESVAVDVGHELPLACFWVPASDLLCIQVVHLVLHRNDFFNLLITIRILTRAEFGLLNFILKTYLWMSSKSPTKKRSKLNKSSSISHTVDEAEQSQILNEQSAADLVAPPLKASEEFELNTAAKVEVAHWQEQCEIRQAKINISEDLKLQI
jgi:hypothetical protein